MVLFKGGKGEGNSMYNAHFIFLSLYISMSNDNLNPYTNLFFAVFRRFEIFIKLVSSSKFYCFFAQIWYQIYVFESSLVKFPLNFKRTSPIKTCQEKNWSTYQPQTQNFHFYSNFIEMFLRPILIYQKN